jgi:hypothetical protein
VGDGVWLATGSFEKPGFCKKPGFWWAMKFGLVGNVAAKKLSINPLHLPTNHPLHPLQHPLLTGIFHY